MATEQSLQGFIDKVSNLSQYINASNTDQLCDNLQNLTKILYQYGQNEKSYKKSNKKSRNLANNLLVTENFGHDEIWSQIKDHSQTVLSTVDQRCKYRTNERERMQQILNELQKDVNQSDIDNDDNLDQLLTNITINDPNDDKSSDGSDIDLDNIAIEGDTDNDDSNQDQQQKDDNEEEGESNDDWIDIIKDHRKKQLDERKDKQKDKDNNNKKENEEEEEIDLDTFQKQTDEMEAFIDKQWSKEKQMAEDGAFDLNDDMFQRALMYDEENDNNLDDSNKYQDEHNVDDDFAFLNEHIAKDSDDEMVRDGANKNDEWNDLFNLPKFKTNSTSQKQMENDKNMKEEMEERKLSKFELEERAIRERIAKLEEENMKPRSWEYQGEVSNNKFLHPNANRKKNSLLSTYIDFDYSDKLKPVITDDLNQSIEQLIITKIKNQQFDDVEKKRDFANAPKIAKRKLIEIQDTKSSMGLAELYEREYLQQVEEKEKIEGDEEFMSTKDGELQKQYEKISRLKSGLFYELDQLVRFHYEPKQAVIADNIKIKTHTRALHLEEAVPFAVSHEAMTMTPEQLYRKPRKLGHIKGENEMTKEDRKNKRRANKKRAKHWKAVREENDKLRARYDQKFSKHLNRIKALNEVRTHAMAAAKKNGFLKGKSVANIEMDNTRWTSSTQMFNKIQREEDNKRNKKRIINSNEMNSSVATPPDKKRKIMSMMH